jgi:hypothetical protein
MNTHKRSGNKWTVNELLSLQREYELLEWTIQEIAEKHQRSVIAILFKLESECLIDSWETARGYSMYAVVNEEEYDQESDEDESDEDEDDESDEDESESDEENYCESKTTKLSRRVSNLEINLKELTSAVNKLCDNIISNKSGNKQFSQDY